jgi:hypothetical protein
MKRTIFILLTFLLIVSGCRKDSTPDTSGTDTIDNTLYGTGPYYAFGFSFSRAAKISSLENPGPDIVIYVNIDNPVSRLTLQADNFKPSFYKVGDFADEGAAKSAFDNLKTVPAVQWDDMADPIADNQVWIYRSGTDYYTKIRIISTVNETRNNIPYGECTFEWVYQPDGSSTFPGK